MTQFVQVYFTFLKYFCPKYWPISFPGHCIFLITGKYKYTIVINWVVYGAINYCESIETIFEMITFVVQRFRRQLMMTLPKFDQMEYF